MLPRSSRWPPEACDEFSDLSFLIVCKDQAEVDYYWTRLLADGGKESMCGWLKDKYGLSC
jgi:predicted 3-demethylubiquinone-9 3-methyltransferase (glyoxalase superfamily)